MQSARARSAFGIVSIILVIHFAVVAWLSASTNLWSDEAYSVNTTSKDLSYAISQAILIEEHPPFFFVVLWFWRTISETVFWARMLSALCTLTFLIVVWRVAVRALPKIHPAWVVGPIAANPSVVYIATEMRAPALTLLVSGLLMWFFIEGFIVESPKRWAVVSYGIASVIALYTYYYLGFLLLANGVALLLTRRPRQIAIYYGLMLAAAIAYIPMLLAIPTQAHSFTYRLADSLSFTGGFRLMIERIQSFLWPSFGLPLPGRSRWIVPGILAAAVFGSLYVNRRKVERPLVVYFALTAVLAIAYSLLAWKLGWRSMLERHATALVVPVYLSVYGILSLYADATRQKVLAAWTAAVGVMCVLGTHALFYALAKPGDWKRVAEFIQANEREREPILVFPPMSAYTFDYYYKGQNRVLAIPRPEGFDRYNHPDDFLQNESEIFAALELVPYEADSIWVIVDCDLKSCADPVRHHNLNILQDFVASYYSVDDFQSFYGARIQHCSALGRLADSQ